MVCQHTSGGQLNPAVSLAFVASGYQSLWQVRGAGPCERVPSRLTALTVLLRRRS